MYCTCSYSRSNCFCWFFDDCHARVAPPLSQATFGVLPRLVERIKHLDRGQVHDAIVSSDDVEKVVNDGGCSIASRGSHVWHCLPFTTAGVVSAREECVYTILNLLECMVQFNARNKHFTNSHNINFMHEQLTTFTRKTLCTLP